MGEFNGLILHKLQEQTFLLRDTLTSWHWSQIRHFWPIIVVGVVAVVVVVEDDVIHHWR